jgi:hypothetical protein
MNDNATTRPHDALRRLCDARGLLDLDDDHGHAQPVPLQLDLYQLDDTPSP